MFELHVTNSDVTSGNIAVGWCVDKETLQQLSDDGVKDPMLVLIVSPEENYDKSKEYRKVVPLKDLVAYIEFRVPGKNKIWGFISGRTKKEARNTYLERYNHSWHHDVLTVSGDEYYFTIANAEDRVAQPISVEVPEGVFAAEPSTAEKAWVNLLFAHKPMNQCEFRRRRMFAYTVQPLLVALNCVFSLVTFIVALLYGARQLSTQTLLHPTIPFLAGFEMFTGGTIFYGRGKNEYLNFARLAFMPPIACLLVFLAHLLFAHGSIAIIVGLTLFLLVLFGSLGYGIKKYVDWRIDQPESDDPAWYMSEEEMNLIVCSGQKKPYTFDNLPANHKTLRLRFENLKSKVCRPFSA